MEGIAPPYTGRASAQATADTAANTGIITLTGEVKNAQITHTLVIVRSSNGLQLVAGLWRRLGTVNHWQHRCEPQQRSIAFEHAAVPGALAPSGVAPRLHPFKDESTWIRA